MRYAFAIVAMAAAMLTMDTRPSAAQQYPWCAYYSGRSGGTYNCGFVNFKQCQATVNGIGGYCQRNPAYVAQQKTRRVVR